jgi:hypothetical protein
MVTNFWEEIPSFIFMAKILGDKIRREEILKYDISTQKIW